MVENTPMYKNEQNEREIDQCRLLINKIKKCKIGGQWEDRVGYDALIA